MSVLFDGEVWLSYSQMYLTGLDVETDHTEAFRGQSNALLGAGSPGALTMMTGTHTGTIALRVVLTETEPPPAEEWPDVVEASYRPTAPELFIVGCTADTAGEVRLPVRDYRARYCLARYRPEGTSTDDGELERCELILWPAAPAPDVVVRVGSDHARWAHRQLDPAAVQEDLQSAWNGDVPSARVRLYAEDLARTDRALTDALDAAPAAVQRSLAYWSVDVACREAGIEGLDWMRETLRALHTDQPLPRWFRPDVVYDRLSADPRCPATGDGGSGGQALFLVLQAVGHDAFGAAAGNVSHLLWNVGEDRAAQVKDLARAELRRLLLEAEGQDPSDRRPQDACGYADPDPDPYLGHEADELGAAHALHTVDVIVSDEAWDAPPPERFAPPPPLGPRERGFVDQVQALLGLDADVVQVVQGAQLYPFPVVLLERARELCAGAGVDGLPWVQASFEAVERGQGLPEPFSSRSWEQALAGEAGREPRWVLVEGERHDRGVLALEVLARWSAFRAWSSLLEAALTVLHALVFAVSDTDRAGYVQAILDDLRRGR
ncbi:hypothetical protein [Kineococcus sp. SYSU DK005]|uniref:hypothetical protein n=1 Tax=Kineococcus sp. SYSU DK005 TaxID=3383126 RepID=UPI003D7DF945